MIKKLILCAGSLGLAASIYAGNLIDKVLVYLHPTWPKLTQSDKEIEKINQQLGTDFTKWGDVFKATAGVELRKKLNDKFDLGINVFEYSRGKIDETEPFIYGSAHLIQKREYFGFGPNLYYNFSRGKTINPFIGLGVSANHLKSSVKMTLEGYLNEHSTAELSDWSPGATISAGANLRLNKHLEFTGWVNYTWGKFKKDITVHDNLVGEYKLHSVVDITGPGVLLGLNYVFSPK